MWWERRCGIFPRKRVISHAFCLPKSAADAIIIGDAIFAGYRYADSIPKGVFHMKNITAAQLREMFQAFMETKGHKRIQSASVIPENDPTVLFTTAGMHPLVP